MNKILIALFIVCLALVGQAFASVEITSSDNAVIIGPTMGPEGILPFTEVRKVSTGTDPAGTTLGAAVGDVMVFDFSNDITGYHVKRASADAAAGSQTFAGVMVTTTSRDARYSYTNPRGYGPTVGYMAIRGLCGAKVDASGCTQGDRLQLNGSTLAASFRTVPEQFDRPLSEDIGTLLASPSNDGVSNVWLK